LPLTELRAARKIWEWHYRFEQDKELKELADGCEKYYRQDPLAGVFHVLFSFDSYEETLEKANELGEQMGASWSAGKIREFLQRAQQFAPKKDQYFNILPIAERAASHWDANKEIPVFVYTALASQTDAIEFAFAATMLNYRLRMLRKSGRQETLKADLQKAIDPDLAPEDKAILLIHLYSRPHPLSTGILTLIDLEFAIRQIDVVGAALKPANRCQILAGMHHVNWESVRSHCGETFKAAEENEKLNCFAALFEAFHFLDLFRKDYPVLGVQKLHFDWLLELMVVLPDLDKIGEYREHEFSQLIQRFGRKPLGWLLSVLAARIAVGKAEEAGDGEPFKLVPTRFRLTMFVLELSPTSEQSELEREQAGTLLEYATRRDLLGYILPQYAADIDPRGTVVPKLVTSRIESLVTKDRDSVCEWARFAGYYGFNSPPWKEIAKIAVMSSRDLPERDRISVFVELLPREIKSSSYPAGEMDPRPERELIARKGELQDETDSDLLRFRRWHLEFAQSNYDHALALYNERNEQ
jgi:hypothetical protein